MLWKTESACPAVADADHGDNGASMETRRRFYTPAATRPLVLGALLCAIVACIVLLQLAVSMSLDGQDTNFSSSKLVRRQLSSTVATLSGTPPTIEVSLTTSNGIVSTIVTTTWEEWAEWETKYLATETPTTSPTYYSDYVVSGVTGASASDFYLDTGTPSITPVSLPAASYLDTGILSTTAASLDQAQLDTRILSSTSAASSPDVIAIATIASLRMTLRHSTSPVPTAFLDTTGPFAVSLDALDAVLSRMTGPMVSASANTTIAGVTTSIVYMTAGPSSSNSISSSSSTLPTVVDVTNLPRTDSVVAGAFTMSRYYVATYICSIVVVLLKVTWGVVFSVSKTIEPFYQLATPGGAHANVSLLADYSSFGYLVAALSGLLTQRPLMLIAIIVSLTTTMMAPIASEAMSIKASEICPKSDGTTRRCAPVWIINVPCIRLLQAFLGLMFFLIIAYIVSNSRRTSGIFTDPSSMASMGSLLGNQDFMRELRQLPTHASTKDIKKLLSDNKYALANFHTETGRTAYGIVKIDRQAWNDEQYSVNANATSSKQTKERKLSTRRRYLEDTLLLLLTLGLLGIILAYAHDHAPDYFNNFFNSNTFGPRFLLSASATLLDYRWKRLEQEVRTLQPYRRLYDKHSTAKRTTEALLANTASTTYTSFLLALRRGDLFLVLVSLTAVWGDVLIIVVAGVPFNDGQIYSSFKISTWLSISILGLMILTNLAVMLFWRRGNPRGMPREPNNLIAVALYLCASRVTESQQLVSLSVASQGVRDRVVRGWRARYWFGEGVGLDGEVRWMVDLGEGGLESSRAQVSEMIY